MKPKKKNNQERKRKPRKENKENGVFENHFGKSNKKKI
jgi:hypothetical protein